MADLETLLRWTANNLPSVDNHVHGEGTLTAKPVIEISETLHLNLPSDHQKRIKSTMTLSSDEAMDLSKFLGLLSTSHAQDMTGIYAPREGVPPIQVATSYYQQILGTLYEQGVRIADLRLSSLNLAAEGDLSPEWINQRSKTLRKKTYLTTPESRNIRRKKLHSPHSHTPLPTFDQLLDIVNTIITTDPHFDYLSSSNTEHAGIPLLEESPTLLLNIIYCIRKVKDYKSFSNESWTHQPDGTLKPPELLVKIADRASRGQITAVDFADIEKASTLAEYSLTVAYLHHHNIPCFFHAGERDEKSAAEARQHMRELIPHADRIGHAYHAFDGFKDFQENQTFQLDLYHPANLLLGDFIKNQIILEINITSNICTGIAPKDPAKHLFILFRKALDENLNLYVLDSSGNKQFLRDLLYTINTDDPAVFQKLDKTRPQIEEVLQFIQLTCPALLLPQLSRLFDTIDRGYKAAIRLHDRQKRNQLVQNLIEQGFGL